MFYLFVFVIILLIKRITSGPYLMEKHSIRNQAHESNRPEKTGKKSHRWLPEDKVRVAMDFIEYLNLNRSGKEN